MEVEGVVPAAVVVLFGHCIASTEKRMMDST